MERSAYCKQGGGGGGVGDEEGGGVCDCVCVTRRRLNVSLFAHHHFLHKELETLLTAKPQSYTNHPVKVCVYGVLGTTRLLEAAVILSQPEEKHDSRCLMLSQ